MDEQEQEHEVYGGEIPGDDGDMDADIDMSGRHDDDQGYDDPNSKATSLSLPLFSRLLLLSISLCFVLKLISFGLVGVGGHEEEAQRDGGRGRSSSGHAGQGREGDGCCSRSLFYFLS